MVFSIIMALFTVYIEYFMSSETPGHSQEIHGMEIHIPSIQGEFIPHMTIAGVPISNTVFSMWLFMVILFIAVGFMFVAIKTRAFPRLRNMGIDLIKRIDDFFYHSLQDKKTARTFFPLVGGFFVYIFLSNVF
jgi:F0F1-type ATP synthase membrane subunit a